MLFIIRLLTGPLLCIVSLHIHSEDQKKLPVVVQAKISAMTQMCEDVGGKIISSPKQVNVSDITGDGISDFIIDEASFICDGAASLFSGSGGSQVSVYIGNSNGNATLGFETGTYGININNSVKPATLELTVGGALCGQKITQEISNAEFKSCWRPVLWNKNSNKLEFAPLSKIRFIQ